MSGLQRSLFSVLAVLGVISCFFVHLPCGPYSATNGPAANDGRLHALDLVLTSYPARQHLPLPVRNEQDEIERLIAFLPGHPIPATPLRC